MPGTINDVHYFASKCQKLVMDMRTRVKLLEKRLAGLFDELVAGFDFECDRCVRLRRNKEIED